VNKEKTSGKETIQPQHSQLKRPSVAELDQELGRLKSKKSFYAALKGTIYTLVVVAAAALLLASTIFRVMRVYGTSMENTLSQRDILIGLHASTYQQGDIIAFYNNNKVLIKRVIATAGDRVELDEDGNVYVNGQLLDEPYLDAKDYGICDITYPVTVGDGQVFVLGDNRATALDSRASAIGNVSTENIICKVVLRIWPFSRWSLI
jgi:signal peptidase I